MLAGALAAALRFRMLLAGLAAGVLVVGVLTVRQMPADVVPELASGPVLEVQTEALGLSSQEVEQYITVPMETNLLDGVMGVWDERSDSIAGLSKVDLYFEPGTTVLHARQLVEERLTNAFSLPNIAKPPLLIQPLSTSSRTLLVGLSSSSLDPLELSYLARWVVQPRLSGVLGVANVAIFGQRDRQIQVQVDPARLAAAHLSLNQIIATAGNAQLVSPLSFLQGSSPGTGGFLDGPNQRLEVRPVLPLGAPRDLAAVPISGAPGHQALGTVTTVVKGHQPLIGDALTQGAGSSLVLLVQKLPGASTLGVTRGVQQALNQLRPALAGVRIDTSFFAPATYVQDALSNLELAGLIAAVLGILALCAAGLSLRAVVIEAVAVAISLLSAIAVLSLLGDSFNALVVLGLLAAATVLVDDAVQGTHELVRRIRTVTPSGPIPIEVAVREAWLPIRGTLGYGTAIVLLTVVPVFFAQGPAATLVHPLVLSFALAVIVSMVVALALAPALAMLLFERGGASRGRMGALRGRLMSGYRRLMHRGLEIPPIALAGVCILGLVGVIAVPFLEPPAAPAFRDRNLVVQWDGPSGASLGEMDRITGRVLRQLRALPAVADTAATLGRAVSGDQTVDASSGQIYIAIRAGADYDAAVNQVRSIVGGTPGIRASVGTYESQVMNGVLSPADHRVVVRVYGEEYGALGSLAGRLRTSLLHLDGLGPAQVQLPAQEPNLRVAVDDDAAVRTGVLPGDARRAASTLVSGLTVGNFFQDQAVFDVVVIGSPSARSTVQEVRQLLIDTSAGHVRLGDVARVSVQADPIDVRHEALSRYVDVSVPVTGPLSSAQASIRTELAKLSFPLGYHAEILGGTPEDPTSHLTFLSYVLAAMIGTLLLLQAAFGSWRLAALFLLVLPVTLVGGLLVALLAGSASSLGADAGLLAVFVLAVRQGMLQIAHLGRVLEREGGELSAELVVRAAEDRLAPALSAAVVIAAVMIPFAVLGNVAGNELTHTGALVILGGLVSTVAVTVVLIPIMCSALGPSTPIAAREPMDGPVPLPVAQTAGPS